MESGPHLILHKVRGEPAYDIAEQIQIGEEWGWIIPTSGHRAYPYWTKPLADLASAASEPEMPADLRDHYTVTRAPKITKAERGQGLAKLIGLSVPKLKIRRING